MALIVQTQDTSLENLSQIWVDLKFRSRIILRGRTASTTSNPSSRALGKLCLGDYLAAAYTEDFVLSRALS